MKKNNILKTILRIIIITLCYYFISSYFFCINVNASTISGGTQITPSNIGTYPSYVTNKDFYDQIRDIFNTIKSNQTAANQELMGSIDDYVYVYADFSWDGSRNNWFDIVFTTEQPTFTYDSVNDRYTMSLTRDVNARYFRYFRNYYSNRYNYSFAWSNWETGDNLNTNINKSTFNANYPNNNYFVWSNNMREPTEVYIYLYPNISFSNDIELNFNYNKYKYFNYFYLDDTLVYTNACGEDDLTIGRFYSCPFTTEEPIEANKVVSKIMLSSAYQPNNFSYNQLGWSDTTDKYYNALIGGYFPDSSSLTEVSLISSSDNSVLFTSNILDTQYTDIFSTTFKYNLFSSAISWNDTTLTGYDMIQATITFPTSSITNFDIWEEGFNNLSSDYIKDNLQVTNNVVQEAIFNNINGNTVSTDNYFNFFTNFYVNNHGLSGFITLPLTYISHLSDTCSTVSIPFPMFPNYSFTLPCMSSIYSQYLGGVFTMYQLILNGIITYWVALNCFKTVKNIHDPKHDKIEVVDL